MLHFVAMASSTGASVPDKGAGLFGDGAKTAAGADPKPKRFSLQHIDMIGSKAFDPCDKSCLAEMDDKTLWTMVSKGDKWAHFFSELATTDKHVKAEDVDHRVGIGISRFSQVMLAAMDTLENDDGLRHFLEPHVLDKLDADTAKLKPHLERLNAGKEDLPGKEDSTFASFKKRRTAAGSASAAPTPDQLQESAKFLYGWLRNPDQHATIMGALEVLAAGGVFFAAYAAARTTVAWVVHKEPAVDENAVQKAVAARRRAPQAASAGRAKADVTKLFAK